jgi:lia operon protein LiaG
MKIHPAFILVISMLAAGFARGDTYSFKEPFTRTGSFSATGSVTLENINGEIKARFVSVAAGQEFTFKTVNGSIAVELPGDAGVALQTSTVNGRVDCDFPLTLAASSGRQSMRGTIGDARASLEAETVNGSIHIERRWSEASLPR